MDGRFVPRAPRRFRTALFALIAALLVVVAAEGLARLALGSDAIVARLRRPWDTPSWRLAWVRAHGTGEPFRFRFDRPHPTRGWTLAPGLREEPAFAGKSVSSTSRGYRGRREPSSPRAPGVARIVALGDSFTFGEGVGDAECWPARLEGLLPSTEVVNLGVHGYGHDQMLVTFREEGKGLAPDVVLLGYVTDDALRNLLGFRDFAKPRFVLEEGRLVPRGLPVPSPEEVLAAEWRGSRLLDLFEMARGRVAWARGTRQAEMTELTFAILAEIFREIRAIGAVPVVADLPVWRELDDPSATPQAREAALAEFCRAQGVLCLPVRPTLLRARQGGLRIDTREHWGPAEHSIAAEAIADGLRRSGVLRGGR